MINTLLLSLSIYLYLAGLVVVFFSDIQITRYNEKSLFEFMSKLFWFLVPLVALVINIWRVVNGR